PDAPAVDIFIDGAPTAITGLEFEQGTAFVELPVGDYTVDVVPAGGVIGDSVLTAPLSIAENTFYTAAAYNSLSDIAILAGVDDLSPTPAGEFRLRAWHTAVGVGTVD